MNTFLNNYNFKYSHPKKYICLFITCFIAFVITILMNVKCSDVINVNLILQEEKVYMLVSNKSVDIISKLSEIQVGNNKYFYKVEKLENIEVINFEKYSYLLLNSNIIDEFNTSNFVTAKVIIKNMKLYQKLINIIIER